jgi:hypothetical protein
MLGMISSKIFERSNMTVYIMNPYNNYIDVLKYKKDGDASAEKYLDFTFYMDSSEVSILFNQDISEKILKVFGTLINYSMIILPKELYSEIWQKPGEN